MIIIKHIGEKHGVYTIVGISDKKASDKHKMYIVECECGERKIFRYSNISYRNTVYKCPHWLIYGDIRIKPNQIKDKRLASIFYNMLKRCYETSDKDYKNPLGITRKGKDVVKRHSTTHLQRMICMIMDLLVVQIG